MTDKLRVGQKVKESPVGPGKVTDFNGRGYPRVNNVAVSWLVLEDGTEFDPHNVRTILGIKTETPNPFDKRRNISRG